MKKEPVTVIIPAFNEEKAVGDVVRKVQRRSPSGADSL